VIARTTGDDGRCALPPRAANVPFFARVERDGFGTVVAGPWSLQSGGALHRVVLREPRAVTGRVVDAAGEPLVKARLTARFPIDRQRNEDSGFAPLRELGFVARAFTGADGEFEFASLPRAVLQVDVQPEGETWPTSTTTLDERALELPIVTAVTAGSATLELTVRDGTLGTGIAAFVASLQPLNDSREWSLTRREFDTASGRASWFELPAGDSLIFVDVPGFVASVAQVHLVAGEARALDVEVFPARDLRLRVLKSDGTPLSPANLLISDREGRPILMRAKPRQTRASAPVGPGGEAALCGLPAALVHVEVIAAGEDFGPSFEFDLARDGGEVHTLVVAEHDGPPQRRIELACPESWRGQRVDVFVADADGRRIASYRSASDNAALELQGGRSALYCHRDATNRLREAWSRALLRWDAADDLAGVPPTSLLVPSSECSLDVFVAGRLVARKRLAADSTGVVVDLRELGGSSTAKQ
jgi:hypothetical protein